MNSNLANDPAVVRFRYRWAGIAPNSGRGYGNGFSWDTLAVMKQVGSVWGIAYSRQARKLWLASCLRRHAGMGPLGPGGIYWLDVDSPYNHNADLKFMDFDELGIATNDESNPYIDAIVSGSCPNGGPGGGGEVYFSPVVGTNVERGLHPNKNDPNIDPAAWDQVGKVSFGDIDISEDGRFLYVVNLYDRKLYEIDLVNPYNPQAPTIDDVPFRIKSYIIPNPCVGVQGEHRPWGLKVKRGKVYVGIICSAQNQDGTWTGGNASDMTANVYSFDISSKSWSVGPVIPSFTFDYRNSSKPWLPWRRFWWVDFSPYGQPEQNGSPIISDIEFDARGNVILGIMDRHASQFGYGWGAYDICGVNLEAIIAIGDIIQAKKTNDISTCQYTYQLNPDF